MADRYYDRDDRERYGRDYGEFSGRGYDRNRDWNRREEGRYGRDDRGFMDRAGDEVRSWFGDEDAARRREVDERRGDRDRSWSDDRSRPSWREQGRGADDWSSRDYRGVDESRQWNQRPLGREPGQRDWSARDIVGREDYPGRWRTSGRGRDYGDDDRSWLGRGPDWGSEFGWGPERREGTSGLYGEGSGRFGAPTGRFAGRGPKGYQRSDERIREDVCDRLTMNPEVDASNIEVQVNAGEVTLRGAADSRFTRRAAEDIAEAIPGVKHVHNEIRVSQEHTAGTGGAGGGMNAGTPGTAGAGSRERERVR
jgi:osmotically-inducible protein OsmY